MPKSIWKPGSMIYPLPVVMVSMGDYENNKDINIITVAWTGTVNSDPAMCYISVRPERYSYDILKEYESFVINITTKELAWATDFCGVRSGRDLDKFEECNLTKAKSEFITAPSIKESPISIECKVKDIIPLGSHHMFLSEVLGIVVDNKYMDKTGKFNLRESDPIAYSHGQYYVLGERMGKFGFSVQKKGKGRRN